MNIHIASHLIALAGLWGLGRELPVGVQLLGKMQYNILFYLRPFRLITNFVTSRSQGPCLCLPPVPRLQENHQVSVIAIHYLLSINSNDWSTSNVSTSQKACTSRVRLMHTSIDLINGTRGSMDWERQSWFKIHHPSPAQVCSPSSLNNKTSKIVAQETPMTSIEVGFRRRSLPPRQVLVAPHLVLACSLTRRYGILFLQLNSLRSSSRLQDLDTASLRYGTDAAFYSFNRILFA